VRARSYKYINTGHDDCRLIEGPQEATVAYFNTSKGYNQGYPLEIKVVNCQVVEIDFPKGGHLDMHHIDPTEIDDGGDAEIMDDEGRDWHIHFDSSKEGNDRSDSDDDQEKKRVEQDNESNI